MFRRTSSVLGQCNQQGECIWARYAARCDWLGLWLIRYKDCCSGANHVQSKLVKRKEGTGLMGAVRPQTPHRSPRQVFGGNPRMAACDRLKAAYSLFALYDYMPVFRGPSTSIIGSPEGRGWEVGFVVEVACRIIRPTVAHCDGLRHLSG